MKALECVNISKSFYKNKVLENISLTVEENAAFQIKGENGSGKTTLLKILAGVDPDFTGEVLFYGKDIQNFDKEYFKNVVMLPSLPRFYNDLTVLENISFYCSIYSIASFEIAQNDIINSFGIEKILNSRIDELSDGFKRRIQLCLGFIIKPRILVIDEPYNFIDKNIKKVFDKEIKKLLAKGSTFIFSDNNREKYDFDLIESVVL